jgi:DNA primase catalytic core
MARLPNEEIERLKRDVSLERLVTGFGIELKRAGKNLMGRCPFHNDKTPSLSVTPSTNRWRCLGACGKGGTTIDWVMKTRGVSFRHAAELLKADHPSLATGDPGKPGRVVRKGTTAAVKLAAPIALDAGDQDALRSVVEFYHQTLKESPEALQYLQGRGFAHPEMVAHFKLGFANRKLGISLPDKNRKAGAVRGRLQKLGIIRDSGHEHMNGSVVFPILNLEGDVLSMYGRKITPNLREGTPLHLYLPGPHRGVWNELALQVSKEIILCEALIDALTFWCAGFRNVTASYGVNGFTEDHRAAFRKHNVQRVWIAYDRDDAGERAALSLAEELIAMGIECFRVLFPKGMDANVYARTTQPAPKSLGILLNSAQWLGKGKQPERPHVEVIATPEVVEELKPAAKEKIAEPEQPTEIDSSLAAVLDSPMISPFAAADDVPTEIQGDQITITLGDRRYRVRGLPKNASHSLMRVNLMASRDSGFHVDTLDLYAARPRAMFIKQAALEMGLGEDAVKNDFRAVLRKVEELQDEQVKKALEPSKPQIQMSDDERAAALELLRDPQLLDRILSDFEKCGLVGEETNKKVAYLAAVSRLLDAPLAVVVQSSSAAGKSSLMDAVLAFVPETQRVQYSAMTGQALFYLGETDLKNKILAIVEEEGAQRAVYALKLLQSEGVLSIASTGKDPADGKMVTHVYRVEGPVMIFLTTTAIEIDEELLNRCLVLTVDEDRAQTRAIHRIQREAQTLEGLLGKRRRQNILTLHRNAQLLLKPIAVVNPHARRMTHPDALTRTRRDHMKLLTLIRTITLLHQYQRPVEKVDCDGQELEYIESTIEDVRLAEHLITQIAGRSLDDMPPQTHRLLVLVDEMVKEQCTQLKMERSDYRFSRRDVRRHTGWSDAQVKRHLRKLEELEYLIVHHGGRGQSFVYELYFQPPADPKQLFLPGISVYDEKKDGVKAVLDGPEGEKDGPSTPQIRGVDGGGTSAENRMNPGSSATFDSKRKKRTNTGG